MQATTFDPIFKQHQGGTRKLRGDVSNHRISTAGNRENKEITIYFLKVPRMIYFHGFSYSTKANNKLESYNDFAYGKNILESYNDFAYGTDGYHSDHVVKVTAGRGDVPH